MQIFVTLVHLPHLLTKKADVEIELDGGLDGFRLTGFQVWIGHDDPNLLVVTFPGRKWAKGQPGYYTYLRPVDERDMGVSDTLKSQILTAYHAEVSKGAGPRTVPPTVKPAPAAAPKAAAAPAAAAPRLVDPRGIRPPRAAAAPKAAGKPTPAEIALAALDAREAEAAAQLAAPAAVEAPAAPAPKAPRGRRKGATGRTAAPPAKPAPAAPARASGTRTAAQAAAWARKPAWQKRKVWSGKGRRKGGAR